MPAHRHSRATVVPMPGEHRATLRTIESNRVVTGVTWADGDPWHAHRPQRAAA